MNTRGKLLLLPALISGLSFLPEGQATAQTFTVLHTFEASSVPNGTNNDGANPSAGLVLSGNVLYGTAKYGGSAGWGTVFAVNTDGSSFSTRYHFTGGSDGATPWGGLILANNILYGTARARGSLGAGTVFALNTNGPAFTVLHSFTVPVNNSFGVETNSDGAYPITELVLSGSSLYGAGNDGGTSGRGTLFAVLTNGSAFATLHSFTSGSGGAYSSAGLILLSDTLYGANYGNLGNGTVFAINTNGTGFTNYYAFTVGKLNGNGILTNSDGAHPRARLVSSGYTLYGTAEQGGISGNGTVFAVNADGTGFTTLHSFAAGAYNPLGFYTNSDGANPTAGLILSGNLLYGTASAGGSSGHGTVFMLNTDGTGFTNLYNFTATPRYPEPQTNLDGANPSGALILAGYALYGTAAHGGSSANGTVFRLSFAPQLTIQSSGTDAILTWPANAAGFDYSGYALQAGPAVNGPFTNIPGATSPYTNVAAGGQQFYRLSQ
jgi:uncharacterized repeat protein (TIGR03803 family)